MVSRDRIPLILDVDTGIDDALALLYACASPEADLVAVTCLSGNVEAQQVAANTRAVLELAGRDDVVVALGRPIPLVRPLEVTPETHGPRGMGYAELPPPARALSDRYAPELIIEEARRRPGELTLVTLGPLTNLAVAMGGTFRAPGNTTPTTEWNIHCDPEAAKIAFGAWQQAVAADPAIPRALAMGLDVTEGAKLLPDRIVELARLAGSTPDDTLDPARPEGAPETRSVATNPVVRFVADALRFYFEFHARYDGFYGAFIHDPFVVAAALDPSLIRTRAVAVDVDVSGGVADGMTVADLRNLWGRVPNVDMAVEGDAGAFLDRLVERIGGLASERASTAQTTQA
jgi:purine nucleosidase